MSLPREGSRVIREGIIVSVPMDWCKSPSAIVPYKIYTHHQVDGANNANSVRQTDAVSHVKESLILTCYGDEPGVGGGCISGTHNAECEPKTWSETVRFEDRNAVRHDDLWWMNHKNCWGRLDYPKDTNKYPTPPEARSKYVQLAQNTATTASDAPMPGQGASEPFVPSPIDAAKGIGQAIIRQPGLAGGVAGGATLGGVATGVGAVGISRGQAIVEDAQRAQVGLPPKTRTPIMNLPLDLNMSATGVKPWVLPQTNAGTRVTGTGDCTPDQHRELQDRLENACGAAKVCKGGDSPEVLQAKIAAHHACLRARKRINDTCYRGGDPGHNDAIKQRENAIANCWKLGGGIPK